MKLYLYGQAIVSQTYYSPVDGSLEGVQILKKQMVELMTKQGINGLSAPQVGHPIQLVVAKLTDGSIIDLVNPQITQMYGPEYEAVERCISFPPDGNSCMVSRIQVVHVKASSVEDLGQVREYKFKGEDARIIQHELDHLEGTFFFERAEVREKLTALAQYREWKNKWKAQRRKEMATATQNVRRKQAVPETTALEAGDLMCAACGQLMKAQAVMGPRTVETVRYVCKNEETGCNYEVTRKVPVTNATQRGIRVDPTK